MKIKTSRFILIALLLFAQIFFASCAFESGEEAAPQEESGNISAAERSGEASNNEAEAAESIAEEAEPRDISIGSAVISTAAEEADISGTDLSGLDFSELDAALGELSGLKKLTMIDCGLDNDAYAALQDAHPDTRLIWEIRLSHWNIRTDTVAFSTMKSTDQTFFMENDEAKYFKYCTDMEALDIGHNHVTDISFLQNMPKLKILILVDQIESIDNSGGKLKVYRIKDLSYVKYCPELVYLEFFCNSVSDMSFLEYTPKLKHLNISYNPLGDASALYKLPRLERLWMEHTNISYEEFTKLKAANPNTQMVYYGEGSIDQGWREVPTYYHMRDCFKNNYIHEEFLD